MNDLTMETLYRDLEEDIKTIEQYNQSMDSASWGYEEGILLTGNQAKAILEHTAQLQADKEELLEALKKANKKAEKWDQLDQEISDYYRDEFNEEENEEYGDGLIGIGEAAAKAFGYL